MKIHFIVVLFVFFAGTLSGANKPGNNSSSSKTTIISAQDTVIFDLSQAVTTSNYVEFPVSVSSDEDIYSLDFSLKFNEAKLQYDSIISYPSYLIHSEYYDEGDQKLRFSSFGLELIEHNTALVSIRFYLLSGEEININDINSIEVSLNGIFCTAKLITAICTGESEQLTAPGGAGSTYLWSTGATTASITATASGTYYATVTNGGSSFITNIFTVIVSPLPDNSVSASSPTAFCAGNSVVLGATTGAGNSYSWSNGVTSREITVTTGGSYSVQITNAYGCSAVSSPVVVTVNPVPDNAVSESGPTTFCQGDSVVLGTITSAGNTYSWSDGQTSQEIIIYASGNYSVQITNVYGCSATSPPVAVTVNPLPDNAVSASGPTTFCAADSVILNAATGIGYTYLWSTGETSQAITVHTAGNYSVQVMNTHNCSAASLPVTVTIETIPEDFNGDSRVNNADFLLFIGKFGTACTCPHDLNHDGFVNNTDFLLFIGKFGTSCD